MVSLLTPNSSRIPAPRRWEKYSVEYGNDAYIRTKRTKALCLTLAKVGILMYTEENPQGRKK